MRALQSIALFIAACASALVGWIAPRFVPNQRELMRDMLGSERALPSITRFFYSIALPSGYVLLAAAVLVCVAGAAIASGRVSQPSAQRIALLGISVVLALVALVAIIAIMGYIYPYVPHVHLTSPNPQEP